jgi:hypothetical protein
VTFLSLLGKVVGTARKIQGFFASLRMTNKKITAAQDDNFYINPLLKLKLYVDTLSFDLRRVALPGAMSFAASSVKTWQRKEIISTNKGSQA